MNDGTSPRDLEFTEEAMNAVREMHYGRLDHLANYIRQANYRIHPIVAKQILLMLENDLKEDGQPPHCLFQLSAIRLKGLPAAYRDPQMDEIRNFNMAIEVARKCQFQRAYLLRACHEVGHQYGLKAAFSIAA